MTKFQKSQIGVINYMLNNWSDDQKIILKHIIRHYPERTNGESTWRKNVDLYKKYHKITKRAAVILDSSGDCKDVHYEHIVPVHSTYKALISLEDVTRENIIEIMNECEVIILSLEEANVLDGSISKTYPLDGQMVNGLGLRSKGGREERLTAIGAEIDERYINNYIKD